MAYFPVQYAVTTSAAKLTTILGLTDAKRPVHISIKNGTANTGKVYIGKSNVTNVPANAGVELIADQTWTYQAGTGARHVSTDDIYIVGSVGAEKVLILVIE